MTRTRVRAAEAAVKLAQKRYVGALAEFKGPHRRLLLAWKKLWVAQTRLTKEQKAKRKGGA